MKRRFVNNDVGFLLVVLLPSVLLIGVLIYYPAIDTLFTSLTSENLRIRRPAEFVFFENYARLLTDDEFWAVTGRSFLIVGIVLPMEMTVAFLIALLLNEQFPGRALVRTLAILPWMLPPVVNGFLWGWLLNGEYGAFNGFLYEFGIINEYRIWLREPWMQVMWVTIVQTWTRFAFPMIILLAGLQGIPLDLYDAAKVDGAGPLQRLAFITFPMLLPSFAVALVVEFIAAFQIFDVIWTLTAGGSAGGAINPFTKTLMIYNYELVFRDLRIGLGAALSYLILIMSLGVGLFFVRRLYSEGLER
jgi:multiple sugar transport system permease protein